MYVPTHFEETRVEVLHALARAQPFAALVTIDAGAPCVDHLPFHLDLQPAPLGTLRGHVARANPVWKTFAEGGEAIVVLQGPQAYISPSWYPSKREHGKVVPTWNYAVVHAHGVPRAVHDASWLRQLVTDLTNAREAQFTQPWQVSDAPREYTDKMLTGIVGIEVPITRLVGKWKTSQNRAANDRAGVVAGLGASDAPNAAAMAEMVRERS